MVRDAFLYRKRRVRARHFLLWPTCYHINFCSKMKGPMRFSVRKPRVCARRKSCLNDTKQSNIWYNVHVRFLKTCIPIGTFRRFRLGGACSMNAKHPLRKRSEIIITCKTQVMANRQHRLGARFDAQVKLHKTRRNQRVAVYAAAIVPPLVLLSIRQRSPSDRRWCPRYVSASIVDPLTTSKPKTLAEPRPVAMSLSYNMYNIGMRDD